MEVGGREVGAQGEELFGGHGGAVRPLLAPVMGTVLASGTALKLVSEGA